VPSGYLIKPFSERELYTTIEMALHKHQMETMLRESEAKYSALVERARDAVYVVQDGVIKFCNKAAEEITGYKEEELVGMPFLDLMAPESRDLAEQRYQARTASKEAPPVYEVKLRCKDGTLKDVEASLTLIQYGGRPAVVGFAQDITERKRLEEERRELEEKAQLASRLATVGEMASGIAHEINNPLTSVVGFSQLLMQKDIPEAISRDLGIICDSAQRVAGIVTRLLAFASQQKPERVYLDINDIIATTLALRAYEMETDSIKVITQLDPDLPRTMADGGQLQEVFLNIIINAEAEMISAYGKGNLLVKTETTDNTIRISFEDDGPGITKRTLDRIFDPFFTTRKVGEGTGLGLSVCHGIVTAHGGRIYAESELGQGATFIVELPQLEPGYW
jgi:PAS domain S-box-containing protein